MSTRQRILEAAAAEFAERGLHGVRMEHVARRAQLNKSLVYRHFHAKDQLFEETLRQEIEKRTAMLDELPADPGELLRFWSLQQRVDAEFVRLIAREGLEHDDGSEPPAAEARRAYYRRQTSKLRELQQSGRLPADLDAEALLFALLLLTVGSILLPQIKALILQDDEAASWEAFLSQFAHVLGRAGHHRGD